MIETSSHRASPSVLRGPAASIRRGDQVAFPVPGDQSGEAVAGDVTGVRIVPGDAMVVLVVANQVHFVPAEHDVVIVREPDSGDPVGRTGR